MITDKLKNEIDLLTIVSELREENVRTELGDIVSIKYLKDKLKEYTDSLFTSLNVKGILNNIDNVSYKFDEECKNILNQDKLTLDDTKLTMEELYRKIYKIEDYRIIIQSYYTTMSRIDSILKVISNSFKSILFTLDNSLFDLHVNSSIKTKSGKDDIITSIMYDLDASVIIIENYKHILWRHQERCGGLVNILLKQESSIRLLYKDIANVQAMERKMSDC